MGHFLSASIMLFVSMVHSINNIQFFHISLETESFVNINRCFKNVA